MLSRPSRSLLACTVLLVLSGCDDGRPTTPPVQPSPTPTPFVRGPDYFPLPYEGFAQLTISVTGACAARFPKELRSVTYRVQVFANSLEQRSTIAFPGYSISNPSSSPRFPVPVAQAQIHSLGGRVDLGIHLWQRLIPSMPIDDSPQLRMQGFATISSLPADSQIDAPFGGEITYYRRGVITPEATCTSQSHRVVLTRLPQ